MKNVLFMCYYNGFHHEEHILYKKIFYDTTKYNVYTIKSRYEIRKSLFEKYDIIFCGCFTLSRSLIEKYAYKMYLDILEPIEYRKDDNVYEIYKKDLFLGYMGCVPYGIKSVKYPLYMDSIGENRSETIEKIIESIDKITFEEFCKKEFCYLINRHDNGNTRTSIFNKLKMIGEITCPSILFNNYSNELFEKEGSDYFRKRFLFALCPENYVTSLDGYVTEKIYFAIKNGNIPIYYGKLDEMDKQIFNTDRILWFDPNDNNSIETTFNIVLNLMNNKQRLFEFYKQNPFTSNALYTLNNIENKYIQIMKQWLHL